MNVCMLQIRRKNLIQWEFEMVDTAQANKAAALFEEMRYSIRWIDG